MYDLSAGTCLSLHRYGKLALVDLAGSERLKETGNTEKGAIRETGSINKSLFTLGQVRQGGGPAVGQARPGPGGLTLCGLHPSSRCLPRPPCTVQPPFD